MAMSYFKERGTDKFIELSFVNITHFSAVMHPQENETLVEMDVFPLQSLQVLMLILCFISKLLILLTFIK